MGRGWSESRAVTKQAWGVIKENPYMLAFPVVSAILAVLAVLVVGYYVARRVADSPFGLSVRGINENRQRMAALGTPVYRRLLAMYTLAGALAGAGMIGPAQGIEAGCTQEDRTVKTGSVNSGGLAGEHIAIYTTITICPTMTTNTTPATQSAEEPETIGGRLTGMARKAKQNPAMNIGGTETGMAEKSGGTPTTARGGSSQSASGWEPGTTGTIVDIKVNEAHLLPPVRPGWAYTAVVRPITLAELEDSTPTHYKANATDQYGNGNITVIVATDGTTLSAHINE